jgi:hypothetical protein
MNQRNNGSRPKVELLLQKPVLLKLLKDKPYEGNSSYGTYLLYTVEQDGVEKAYFATPEVHHEIVTKGAKAGDEIVLTKTAHPNGRRITPKIDVDIMKKRVESEQVEASETQPASLTDGLKTIMETSLKEAVEITRSVQGVPFQNEDIQKIASCLFIARTKANGYMPA